MNTTTIFVPAKWWRNPIRWWRERRESLVGEVILWHDQSGGRYHYCRIVDYSKHDGLATLTLLDGSSLPHEPSENDTFTLQPGPRE